VARVIATDITPGMLDKARKFITSQGVGNVAFEPADAEDLPFEDASFDLVTCRIAPHHFQDCARFVRECARVLRHGGMLLVQDLALPEDEGAARYIDAFERLRDPSHNRGYAKSEWLSMFQAANLVPDHVELIVKEHQFEPWARRQACTPETIEELIRMVAEASEPVLAWMQPRNFGRPDASFVNNHLLVAGRRLSPEPVREEMDGSQGGLV
jgi:ubiquinone/menaquinone biosynthesis C-methylase UbiE